MDEDKTKQEEFKVDGEQLLAKVKELIRQGNIRRIILKNKDGKVLIEIPFTVGVVGVGVGVLVVPVLAAVGAIAALVTECTIVVIRQEK